MFPIFNRYSLPILILALQGLVLAFLLFSKYKKTGDKYNVWMSLILATTCYQQTVYILGFMGWYDTFPTTKINYFYTDLRLVIGPLLYFMIRSIYEPILPFKRRDLWHFSPIIIYIVLKIFIGIYDALQPNFSEVQNGPMTVNFQWKILDPLVILISVIQTAIYLVLCFQMLGDYKRKIAEYFSTNINSKFNWIKVFLILYTVLFAYNLLQDFVNAIIVEISYYQGWWYYFTSGIVVIYLGFKGYNSTVAEFKEKDVASFINQKSNKLHSTKIRVLHDEKHDESLSYITKYMSEEKPYLDPSLTLVDLANLLKISREELSLLINRGLGIRFNDFINSYRIKEFKSFIVEGLHKNMSLYGLALDSGFNSKATFNRVFKKEESMSPSQYAQLVDRQSVTENETSH